MSRTYHFIVFFLFSFFLFATINKNKKIKTKHLLIVLIISIAYAISDEIHQLFVTFRNFSIKDILTDTLGIFSSIIIYSHINQKTLKQPS
ncbi:VanZ family protein [Candidatus Pacearchaeota archaeon]|nr:VanZ family protein [Candidatus Pacearchaeota archaeon]